MSGRPTRRGKRGGGRGEQSSPAQQPSSLQGGGGGRRWSGGSGDQPPNKRFKQQQQHQQQQELDIHEDDSGTFVHQEPRYSPGGPADVDAVGYARDTHQPNGALPPQRRTPQQMVDGVGSHQMQQQLNLGPRKKKTRRAPKRRTGENVHETPYSELPWEARRAQLEADSRSNVNDSDGDPSKRKRLESDGVDLNQQGKYNHARAERFSNSNSFSKGTGGNLASAGANSSGTYHHQKHPGSGGKGSGSKQKRTARINREQPPPAPHNTTQSILNERASASWVPPSLPSSLGHSPSAPDSGPRLPPTTNSMQSAYDADSDFNSAFDDAMSTTYEGWDRNALIDKILELDAIIVGLAEDAAAAKAVMTKTNNKIISSPSNDDKDDKSNSKESLEIEYLTAELQTVRNDMQKKDARHEEQVESLVRQMSDIKDDLERQRQENMQLEAELRNARDAEEQLKNKAMQMSKSVLDIEAQEASEFAASD